MNEVEVIRQLMAFFDQLVLCVEDSVMPETFDWKSQDFLSNH